MANLKRDELINQYLEGARNFFPELQTSTIISLFSNDLPYPSSGEIEFNNKISANDTYEIIHYTSLHAFLEIINSQSIRMYNCNNMNDLKEIEHGLSQMNFQYDEEWLKKIKRNHFILSSSRYDKKEGDNFNMWRLYGQNGMGIGLVFEVPKKIENWKNISINEVEYTSKNTISKTKQFLDFHKKFQESYQLFENTPRIIPLLASFHKDEIWSMENETRLVAHCPYNEYTFEAENNIFNNYTPILPSSLSHTISSNGKPVAYVQMPISRKIIDDKIKPEWSQEIKVNVLNNHPYLQLKSIIIGPQLYNSPKYFELNKLINYTVVNKLGTNLNIQNSKFNDLYK